MSGKTGPKTEQTMFTDFLKALSIDVAPFKGMRLENQGTNEIIAAAQPSVSKVMRIALSRGDSKCLSNPIAEANGILTNLQHKHPQSPECQTATIIAEYFSEQARNLPKNLKGKSDLTPRLAMFKDAGKPAVVSAS